MTSLSAGWHRNAGGAKEGRSGAGWNCNVWKPDGEWCTLLTQYANSIPQNGWFVNHSNILYVNFYEFLYFCNCKPNRMYFRYHWLYCTAHLSVTFVLSVSPLLLSIDVPEGDHCQSQQIFNLSCHNLSSRVAHFFTSLLVHPCLATFTSLKWFQTEFSLLPVDPC